MEFLSEYGLFLAKAVTVVVAFGVIVVLAVAAGARGRGGGGGGHIELTRLNDRYREFKRSMQDGLLQGKELKKARKAEKKENKKQQAADPDAPEGARLRLYVLNFKGDIKASATECLREEISAVLGVARSGDEVLLRLESQGGMVHSYGLAASQLQRVRDAGIQLTVAVDKVAASGGYMMACVANKIMAAPFAVIGSIGVLMQLPNFNRLLKKANIDFEQMTAGEYKRTLTMFGENSDDDRAKMQEDLEDTHQLFKDFVSTHREGLDMDSVATGEIWYGQRAINQGLIDELQTSDSFIQQCLAERDVFEVSYVARKNWQEKLGVAAESAIERAILKVWASSISRHKY